MSKRVECEVIAVDLRSHGEYGMGGGGGGGGWVEGDGGRREGMVGGGVGMVVGGGEGGGKVSGDFEVTKFSTLGKFSMDLPNSVLYLYCTISGTVPSYGPG